MKNLLNFIKNLSKKVLLLIGAGIILVAGLTVLSVILFTGGDAETPVDPPQNPAGNEQPAGDQPAGDQPSGDVTPDEPDQSLPDGPTTTVNMKKYTIV